MNISDMSREELVQFVLLHQNDMVVFADDIRQALNRIDEIDGVSKKYTAIDAINEETFDSLPLEDQLRALMKANQELIDEAREMPD